MPTPRTLLGVILALWIVPSAVRCENAGAAPAPRPLCDLIADAARRYQLPPDFFTRLIWRESRFDLGALSPAGARGVAQFMPQTAAERGLADPFAAREALFESAAYLNELRGSFGNLGLAAAAYNAGPGRVSRWLAGQSELPQETLDYVLAITGHDAAEWNAPQKPVLNEEKDFSCARYAAHAGDVAVHAAPSSVAPAKPWAVILLGNPQRDKVMSEYQMVKGRFSRILGNAPPTVVHRRISGIQIARYIVQIEQETRAGADTLCSRLLRAGGNCFVLANR